VCSTLSLLTCSSSSNRTREEIQRQRSTNDPITGLKTRIIDWNILSENELKQVDKEAREVVDHEVEEAKKSPDPDPKTDMWTDVYLEVSSRFPCVC
jgi:pyruvate dehydrogenase E1 component alpha subunit